MNLGEISCFLMIVLVLANGILLVSRETGRSKKPLVQGAIALVLLIVVVHACVRMIPRSRFLRAAARGNLGFVKDRVEHDPSLIRARGLGDWTALHHAARHNRLEVIEYLVEQGASMDAMAMGETPFGLAVAWGHYEGVEWMLGEGVDVNQRSFRNRSTAIHIAATNGHLQIVRLLLDWGADPTLPDKYSQGTPMTDAKTEAIRTLLSEHGTR